MYKSFQICHNLSILEASNYLSWVQWCESLCEPFDAAEMWASPIPLFLTSFIRRMRVSSERWSDSSSDLIASSSQSSRNASGYFYHPGPHLLFNPIPCSNDWSMSGKWNSLPSIWEFESIEHCRNASKRTYLTTRNSQSAVRICRTLLVQTTNLLLLSLSKLIFLIFIFGLRFSLSLFMIIFISKSPNFS